MVGDDVKFYRELFRGFVVVAVLLFVGSSLDRYHFDSIWLEMIVHLLVTFFVGFLVILPFDLYWRHKSRSNGNKGNV